MLSRLRVEAGVFASFQDCFPVPAANLLAGFSVFVSKIDEMGSFLLDTTKSIEERGNFEKESLFFRCSSKESVSRGGRMGVDSPSAAAES